MQTLGIELTIFLKAAGSGAFLLFLYDFLRGTRRGLEKQEPTGRVGDLLFGIGSGVFLFCRIYSYNGGMLRGYIFLGILSGSVLYSCTISRIVLFCVSFLTKRLKLGFLWVRIKLCRHSFATWIMGFVKNEESKENK